MGVPVRLVAAVTPNDIVHRTFQTGDYSLSETVLQTWATAMDIQVPYNVERIILMAADLDTSRVAELMAQFESESRTRIPGDLLELIKRVGVDTMMVETDDMVRTMKTVYDDNDGAYCVCPHTAVGVAYHYKHQDTRPQVYDILNSKTDIVLLQDISLDCVGYCSSRQVS